MGVRAIYAPATPMVRQIAVDLPVLMLVGIIFAVCSTTLFWIGVNPFRPSSYLSNLVLYTICWGGFELYPFVRRLFIDRPESPFRFLAQYAPSRLPILIHGLPLVIALVVFMPMFSAMKSAIPLFTQYTWDQTFIYADRVLFGTDPWRILQPVLGHPIITSAISLAYHGWFLLIYAGCTYFAAYVTDEALRRRFFLCFFGTWTICGIAMAIGFASVGPCFTYPLLGIHTFDAQMEYLHRANDRFPILVLQVQARLLAWHQSGQHGLGRGITAMPSMHVALATLFWLAVRHVSKRAGYFFAVFLAVIFIGSVHLAYHYAVDGIVAAGVTIALWQLGRLLGREPAPAAPAV